MSTGPPFGQSPSVRDSSSSYLHLTPHHSTDGISFSSYEQIPQPYPVSNLNNHQQNGTNRTVQCKFLGSVPIHTAATSASAQSMDGGSGDRVWSEKCQDVDQGKGGGQVRSGSSVMSDTSGYGSVKSWSTIKPNGDNRQAVMHALYNLQEKIRRLEIERNSAAYEMKELSSEATKFRHLLSASSTPLVQPSATHSVPLSTSTGIQHYDHPVPLSTPTGRQHHDHPNPQSTPTELQHHDYPVSSGSRTNLKQNTEKTSTDSNSEHRKKDYHGVGDTSSSATNSDQKTEVTQEVAMKHAGLSSALKATEARCRQLEDQLESLRRVMDHQERANREEGSMDRLRENSQTRFREVEEVLEKEQRHKARLLQAENAMLQTQVTAARILADNPLDRCRTSRCAVDHIGDPTRSRSQRCNSHKDPHTTHPRHSSPSKLSRVVSPRRSVSQSKSTSTTVSGATGQSRPFIVGQSTSSSHHVGANIQSVMGLLKSCPLEDPIDGRSTAFDTDCDPDPEMEDNDLDDLMADLQEEFSQLTKQHQSLVHSLHKTVDNIKCDKLQTQLNTVIAKMELKGEQIKRLRSFKRKNKDLHPCCSEVSRGDAGISSGRVVGSAVVQRGEVEIRTTVKTRDPPGEPPLSHRGDPGWGRRTKAMKVLHTMRQLQKGLKHKDVTWE